MLSGTCPCCSEINNFAAEDESREASNSFANRREQPWCTRSDIHSIKTHLPNYPYPVKERRSLKEEGDAESRHLVVADEGPREEQEDTQGQGVQQRGSVHVHRLVLLLSLQNSSQK